MKLIATSVNFERIIQKVILWRKIIFFLGMRYIFKPNQQAENKCNAHFIWLKKYYQ